jgi:hypothetical protein
MASSVPPPLYNQVQRGSARIRARDRVLGRLRPVSYRVAAATGAAFGALVTLTTHVERVLPSLNPQVPAWQGFGPDLLFTTVSGALFLPLAILVKRVVASLYLRIRFGARAA